MLGTSGTNSSCQGRDELEATNMLGGPQQAGVALWLVPCPAPAWDARDTLCPTQLSSQAELENCSHCLER